MSFKITIDFARKMRSRKRTKLLGLVIKQGDELALSQVTTRIRKLHVVGRFIIGAGDISEALALAVTKGTGLRLGPGCQCSGDGPERFGPSLADTLDVKCHLIDVKRESKTPSSNESPYAMEMRLVCSSAGPLCSEVVDDAVAHDPAGVAIGGRVKEPAMVPRDHLT